MIFYVDIDGTTYPAIAGGGGGGSESTTTIPGASSEELADRLKARGLAATQDELFFATLATQFPSMAGFLLRDKPDLLAAIQPDIQAATARQQMFEGGGIAQLSPADEAQLGQAYSAARAQGSQDIFRQADELAGGRGLRMSDTPVAGEALRAQQQFSAHLESQAAMNRLNLGLGLRQQQMGFQQQRFGNALGLSQIQSPYLPLLGLQLSERTAQPTTISSTQQPFAQKFGQVLQGVGGLAKGASGFFAPAG